MAKFKVGDKVRLKEGLEVGKEYGGILLLYGMKEDIETDGGVHEVKEVKKIGTITVYVLDTDTPYCYTEERLEAVEEKDFNDLLEVFMLMSQLERIVNRLDEITKKPNED